MRNLALATVAAAALWLFSVASAGAADPSTVLGTGKKPNIVIIWGDDIGQSNISVYSRGMMGYQTPNIDRIAREGMMFTDLMSRIFTLK